MKSLLPFLFLFIFCGTNAQKKTLEQLDSKSGEYETIALKIWDWAEVGYKEVQSSELLQQTLSEAGWKIQKGGAGRPTAFLA